MTLFTISEAAQQLRLHPITIRRYIREGKLAALQVGGRIRITEETLAKFSHSHNPLPHKKPPLGSKSIHHRPFTPADPLWRLKGAGTPI